jgi:plastocyanin
MRADARVPSARTTCGVLLAVIASLALACSSKRAPVVHRVEIQGMQFVPAELTVAVGDTVEWTNVDLVPHTVTSPGLFDSGSLATRQPWRYTVTRAGELAYTCTFHPTMHAKLTAR